MLELFVIEVVMENGAKMIKEKKRNYNDKIRRAH